MIVATLTFWLTVRDAVVLAQQHATADLMFLHRLNPVMRPLFDWTQLDHVYCERLAEDGHELAR